MAGKSKSQDRTNPFSREARFQTLELRIKAAVSALTLWDRVFDHRDRKKLGGDLEVAWRTLGTAGMWMLARRVSRRRAILDVAHKLNHLSDSDYRWLLREINEEGPTPGPKSRPQWVTAKGELWFGRKLIRSVRIVTEPSNIQRILDAFEEAGWASRIPNSFDFKPEQLHQALRCLNCGLKRIRFHSSEGGRFISWDTA